MSVFGLERVAKLWSLFGAVEQQGGGIASGALFGTGAELEAGMPPVLRPL
jgi:hypothetical protein